MSETDDLKAQLMREVDASIAKMLAECPAADQITLSDMERLVSQAGREIQNRVLQRLVEAKQVGPASERPVCERCQQPMNYKGQHRRRVVTEDGEIEVERAYYYCATCREGLFPPG
jgi:hypothetical protein